MEKNELNPLIQRLLNLIFENKIEGEQYETDRKNGS